MISSAFQDRRNRPLCHLSKCIQFIKPLHGLTRLTQSVTIAIPSRCALLTRPPQSTTLPSLQMYSIQKTVTRFDAREEPNDALPKVPPAESGRLTQSVTIAIPSRCALLTRPPQSTTLPSLQMYSIQKTVTRFDAREEPNDALPKVPPAESGRLTAAAHRNDVILTNRSGIVN